MRLGSARGWPIRALDNILASGFVDHVMPPGIPPGIESFETFRRQADASMRTVATIADLFVAGDRSCARIVVGASTSGR